MDEKYITYCMDQVIFWENMLEKAMKPKQDDIIIKINEVLKTRNVERLRGLYDYLEELKESNTISDADYKNYLHYISTTKVA